jgi:hypothetical protein
MHAYMRMSLPRRQQRLSPVFKLKRTDQIAAWRHSLVCYAYGLHTRPDEGVLGSKLALGEIPNGCQRMRRLDGQVIVTNGFACNIRDSEVTDPVWHVKVLQVPDFK